ncbi:MAG: protein kinase domain-containing protein [Bradymonadaceae bacterium]
MSQEKGKCPGCDTVGPLAQACIEKACAKRGHHYIPISYWNRVHSEEGAVPDSFIGMVLGDYLVVDFIGSGGFGKVYLVLQLPLLGLKGAVKLIEFPSDEEGFVKALLEKFQGEAQVLAQLNHPNIVRLLKYGLHGGRPYLVMEYVEGGRALRDEVALRIEEKRAFSREEIRHIIHQVLNGLQAAHEAGIIHRDIKPENIMIQPVAGNPLFMRLLDFGMAKYVKKSGDTLWPLGSPNYMAPEQTTLKNLGPWTDLYALAIIAFELLAGRRPYPGQTEEEVLLKKIDEDYDPLVELDDLNWPPEARDFFARALHRSAEGRIQETARFREAFDEAIDALTVQNVATVTPSPRLTMALDTGDLRELNLTFDDIVTLQPSRLSVALGNFTKWRPFEEASLHSFSLLVVGIVAFVVLGTFLTTCVVLVIGGGGGEDSDEAVMDFTASADDFFFEDEADGPPPTPNLPDRPLQQVVLAETHTCVLLQGGDVRCWGANGDGQLGLASTEAFGHRTPAGTAPLVEVGGPVIQLAAAGGRRSSYTCALLASRNIRCWGANRSGQLGYGHTNSVGDKVHPREVGMVDVGGPVLQIAMGASETFAHTCVLLHGGTVRCFGDNRHGQLGYGHTKSIGDAQVPASVDPVDIGARVKELSAGQSHSCALLETGNVRCWGLNRQGQLGYGRTGNVGDKSSPAEAGDVDIGGLVRQVSLGRSHTCALLETKKVRCWGWNGNGQLGYGHTEDVGTSGAPAKAGDIDVGGLVESVSAGGLHTCALLVDGAVRCWGGNEFGQLGYGHTRPVGNEYAPWSMGDVPLGGRAVAISAGEYHTCAILEDESLKCWGLNKAGQLGHGHTNAIGERSTPVAAGDVPL